MSDVPRDSVDLVDFLDPQTDAVQVPLIHGGCLRSGWQDRDDPDFQLAGDWLAVHDAAGKQVFCISAEDFTCMDTMTVQRTLLNLVRVCAGVPALPDRLPFKGPGAVQ